MTSHADVNRRFSKILQHEKPEDENLSARDAGYPPSATGFPREVFISGLSS
jgi:hypothetical protein